MDWRFWDEYNKNGLEVLRRISKINEKNLGDIGANKRKDVMDLLVTNTRSHRVGGFGNEYQKQMG